MSGTRLTRLTAVWVEKEKKEKEKKEREKEETEEEREEESEGEGAPGMLTQHECVASVLFPPGLTWIRPPSPPHMLSPALSAGQRGRGHGVNAGTHGAHAARFIFNGGCGVGVWWRSRFAQQPEMSEFSQLLITSTWRTLLFLLSFSF